MVISSTFITILSVKMKCPASLLMTKQVLKYLPSVQMLYVLILNSGNMLVIMYITGLQYSTDQYCCREKQWRISACVFTINIDLGPLYEGATVVGRQSTEINRFIVLTMSYCYYYCCHSSYQSAAILGQ